VCGDYEPVVCSSYLLGAHKKEAFLPGKTRTNAWTVTTVVNTWMMCKSTVRESTELFGGKAIV
jgi:hypothetical protein